MPAKKLGTFQEEMQRAIRSLTVPDYAIGLALDIGTDAVEALRQGRWATPPPRVVLALADVILANPGEAADRFERALATPASGHFHPTPGHFALDVLRGRLSARLSTLSFGEQRAFLEDKLTEVDSYVERRLVERLVGGTGS